MKKHKPTATARRVYEALEKLGGEATTREIADKAMMSNNGVSVSLCGMAAYYGHNYVKCLGGKRTNARLRNEVRWKIIKPMP